MRVRAQGDRPERLNVLVGFRIFRSRASRKTRHKDASSLLKIVYRHKRYYVITNYGSIFLKTIGSDGKDNQDEKSV